MREKSPELIGTILQKVWNNIEKKREERVALTKIEEDIRGVLGKKLYSHIKLTKPYRKKMTILVDTPVYLQEVVLNREALVDIVNESTGKEIIREVKFRVGEK